MLQRDIEDRVFKHVVPGKVVLLFGARRVGKTVLLQQIMDSFKNQRISFLNGEDFSTSEMLSIRTVSNYKQLFEDTDLLVIDEAQSIQDIGKILKLIVDNIKGISVIVSGSSSFDLYNQTGEPLVGRSYHFKLYPFSQKELLAVESRIEAFQRLEERLVYGMYPELISMYNYEQKKNYLLEIANSYLLKDILMIDGIKNSAKMKDLLRLIAFQTGSEVSYNELAKQLGLSRNTVEKYLDLLTKTYVIYKLPSYSKNPRNEISKSSKWFFMDNGIRNAVINDFKPLSMRQDVGALWENFIISERIKKNNNENRHSQFYFWRTYSGQEIDLIEENEGQISAYEFKWNDKKVKKPSFFNDNYPDVIFEVVNKNNYLEFVL